MSPAPFANSTANSSSSFNSILFGVTRVSRFRFTRSFRFAASGQLIVHLVEIDVTSHEQHQQVIEQIGDFRNELFRIFVLRRDDRLRRLLADLLQYLVKALVEKISRIGTGRPLEFAALNQSVKLVQKTAGLRFTAFEAETRLSAGVTSRAGGIHQHDDRVMIAVARETHDLLRVS